MYAVEICYIEFNTLSLLPYFRLKASDKRSIFLSPNPTTGNMAPPTVYIPAPPSDGNDSNSSLEITLIHPDSGGDSEYKDA